MGLMIGAFIWFSVIAITAVGGTYLAHRFLRNEEE